MAIAEQDFEKGEADGTVDALRVLGLLVPLEDDDPAHAPMASRTSI
jgi:hypothetical protein